MKDFTFLVASERSGSNFLTSLMDGHSRVCGPPPTHLFRLFGTNRNNYGDLDHDATWRELIADVVLNLSCKLGEWNTSVSAEELEHGVEERSAAALLRFIYEKEADHDGAGHLFVKENHTHSFAPYLLAHFPGCRFVLLVRDPRDVAASWVRTESIPGGVEKAVEVWTADQSASLELYGQLRDSGRIRIARYEELVREPEAALEKLTRFLGLAYEPGMLRFHRQHRTVANAERIDAWANLSKPVLRDNYGKYRDVLSEADVRFVELATWELMDAFGYRPEQVTEAPGDDRAARLEALRPSLSPGSYTIESEAEREIRRRRLAAIERVLSRRP